jgi:polyisoprenoid-binding protein YceI
MSVSAVPPLRPPRYDRRMVAHRRLQLPDVHTMNRAAPLVALTVAALCLAACRTVPGLRPRAAPPPAVAAPIAGSVRYRVDAARSEVLILVYRDGRLASLGHNHVLAVRDLSGEVVVAADVTQSSWQLQFPVAALSVDEPQLRAAQGAEFQTTIDAAAIAATRDHMLGPLLLDAAHYPAIHLQSEQVRSEADGLRVATRIVVRDHAAQVEVPVALQRSSDELTASGEFDLTHAELGLTPYSIALGALRVADRMHVRYRLVAQRDSDAPR